MPRTPKPRWKPTHRRWVMAIGDADARGKCREVYAPPEIGERDEPKAWEWFAAEQSRRQRAVAPTVRESPTVKRISEHYLAWADKRHAMGKLSDTHHRAKGYHLGIWCAAMGSRVASTLDPVEDMDPFIKVLERRYSLNYINNVCATISAALNWAVRSKMLVVNPIKGFEVPTVPVAEERYAERSEAAVFLRHWLRRVDRDRPASKWSRNTLLLERVLIRTGARPGELCDLWWSDMRWNAGVTSAGHTFAVAKIPPERHKTGGKTGKARTIYFTPTLTRALRRIYSRRDRHPVYVFTHGRGRGGTGEGQPWESGSRLSQSILRVRRELIAAQEEIREKIRDRMGVSKRDRRKAAILIKDDGPDRLTNYRWRHTAISSLLMMGVDVPTVAELTGTSATMIYRHYGHLLDHHLQAAAEKLSNGGRRDRPRSGSTPKKIISP